MLFSSLKIRGYQYNAFSCSCISYLIRLFHHPAHFIFFLSVEIEHETIQEKDIDNIRVWWKYFLIEAYKANYNNNHDSLHFFVKILQRYCYRNLLIEWKKKWIIYSRPWPGYCEAKCADPCHRGLCYLRGSRTFPCKSNLSCFKVLDSFM